MEFTVTTKGRPAVAYNGYRYRQLRESKDGVITWVCLAKELKKCTGRLRSQNNSVVYVSEHLCGTPSDVAVEVKKQVEKCKKRAREENTKLSEIYDDEMGTLHNKGYDFVTKMPRLDSLKRTLRLQRCKARGNQQEPKEASEVTLNEEELQMSDGSSFLLADDGVEERIIIFCGARSKATLKTSTQFFMDGTFKSCSKQFAQIYTIHADFGSEQDESNVYPVLFALLPNKKKETYIRMFNLIKGQVPDWSPENVNVDFESASISALREVFPECRISGCFFHMKQCLWRKVQNIGLTDQYRTNEEVRSSISMCAALAFLKPEDVDEGWLEIQAEAPSSEKMNTFFDYFVESWLENENIPVTLWSCHGKKHRTTNAVEGWHSKINASIGNPNPRVRTLIECLKKEAEHSEHMAMRNELSLPGKKRRKTYVKFDEVINKVVAKYEKTRGIRSCLKTIAHMQHLD